MQLAGFAPIQYVGILGKSFLHIAKTPLMYQVFSSDASTSPDPTPLLSSSRPSKCSYALPSELARTAVDSGMMTWVPLSFWAKLKRSYAESIEI